MSAILLVQGEPIQWHRPNSVHDRCDVCGGKVWLVGKYRRFFPCQCHGEGMVRELRADPKLWLEQIGFNDEEIAKLMKRGGIEGRGNRSARYVRPGFLGVVQP